MLSQPIWRIEIERRLGEDPLKFNFGVFWQHYLHKAKICSKWPIEMRVKGSEWNALLKEGNTGWRRSAAALWIITGVAPGAACSRSSSPQRGHRKAPQCTSQPALHKIQQKAPIEWTVENILQYDTEQYNLSDVSIREHFLCSSRKTAAICLLFVPFCSCVFLNARYFSAVWTDKLD